MLDDALEHLVRGIVDYPDDVVVRERQGRGTTLEVQVNPEDMGRVIGKAGRTASALRTVLNAISTKGNVRIDILDVDER
ncbi:MAG: RNA-binding protein [Actinobacteria bacterium]|nr:RNA-binding protein [Actinomycetota bacterium]NBY14811.1 RNA-binding protein [Actinomycetota bacterium]